MRQIGMLPFITMACKLYAFTNREKFCNDLYLKSKIHVS